MNLLWRIFITILLMGFVGAAFGGTRAHMAYPQVLEDYGIEQAILEQNIQRADDQLVYSLDKKIRIFILLAKIATTSGGFFALSFSLAIICSIFISLIILLPAHFALRRLALWPRLGLWTLWGLTIIALILESIHPLLNLRSVPEGPRTTLNFVFESVGYAWVNGFVYLMVLGSITSFVGLAKRWPAGELEAISDKA